MSDWTLPAIPDDWLPPEVVASSTPGAGTEGEAAPGEWVPSDLPQPEPDPAPRRRRTAEHQVPLPGGADQPAATEPAAASAAVAELLRERSDLLRERRRLLREREVLQAELEATRADLEAARASTTTLRAPKPQAATPRPRHARGAPPTAGASGGADPVNLNTATVDELLTLPTVGRRAAERIVQSRERNGPFRSLEDVGRVDGFHADRLKRFADRVTV